MGAIGVAFLKKKEKTNRSIHGRHAHQAGSECDSAGASNGKSSHGQSKCIVKNPRWIDVEVQRLRGKTGAGREVS